MAQVFITDVRATKKQIKNAVLRLYDIQTKRINTLVRCMFLQLTRLESSAPDIHSCHRHIVELTHPLSELFVGRLELHRGC